MHSSLVRFGLDVGLERIVVDEMLRAVDTVELGQPRLVKVDGLIQQLLHLPLLQVHVNLVQILCSPFSSPALLQVRVAGMELFTTVSTRHCALVEVNQARAGELNGEQRIWTRLTWTCRRGRWRSCWSRPSTLTSRGWPSSTVSTARSISSTTMRSRPTSSPNRTNEECTPSRLNRTQLRNLSGPRAWAALSSRANGRWKP